jgi:phosphate transport system substrate-binding protein
MSKRFAVLALAGLLAACGGPDRKTDASGPAPAGSSVTGAGATFPAPLYARWAGDYRTRTGVGVNYQPIGSGGGIRQITAGTIDFGGSDKPLSLEALSAAGLVQFPAVLGGVVPVFNLPGVAPGQLRLTGAQLAAVFRGDITRWSDPRLASAASGAALPNLPITVVHRSDASGTTYLFTHYLALKSPAWKRSPGAGEALEWPVGLGGKGNDGVAAFVRQTAGSIGYVEYAYAKQTRLPYALLQNASGAFVAPTAESFAAGAAGADWAAAPGFDLLLLDEPGAGAWPITGATFILVHGTREPAKAAETVRFFDWAFGEGDADAVELGYVPLPAEVKTLVRAAWRTKLGVALAGR